jgi:hypothetical protein
MVLFLLLCLVFALAERKNQAQLVFSSFVGQFFARLGEKLTYKRRNPGSA